MTRLGAIFFAGIASAAALFSQTLPYELKLDAQPGAVIVTFSTANGQARVYLPDDLAPGDAFSGTAEASRNFLVEFAGQSIETRAGTFHWTVASTQTDAFIPLILRDLKGQELARASIRLPAATARSKPADMGVPRMVQAGRAFPIFGAFDGNLKSTAMVIGGEAAKVLAESPRKAVVRAPDSVIGPVDYQLAANGVTTGGQIRILAIELAPSSAAARAGNPAAFDLSVKGLAGIAEEVPLRVGGNYFFLRPDLIPADGIFTTSRIFDGVVTGSEAASANLVVPQTPDERVGVILRTPRRAPPRQGNAGQGDNVTGEEHAHALRALDFDAVPVAARFLADFDLGSDAAYAMLALDEPRALALLFDSMPRSGQNIERLTLAWFLDHYDFVQGSPNAVEAHAAALRLLERSANSGTVVTDLALYAVGLTGSDKDFPLLENFYDNRDRWAGLKGTHDASQAALTRLGSRKHLEAIRAELADPLPKEATLPQGVRLVQALDKAGYTGSRELAPEVCSHIADPYVLEIDIGTDPGRHALAALSAIVDGTNPRSSPARRTPDGWRAWCEANGKR